MSCDAPAAFLEARLAGAFEAELRWQASEMDCDGMRRPDGKGLRIRFEGTAAGEHLTLVFAAPRLAEGESAHAVPVNLTVIRGGAIYGTRGEGRCLLDDVRQAPLVGSAGEGPRRWAVEARGFCLEPARAVAGNDAILLSRFDFRGQIAWDPDPPAAPAPEPAPGS